MATDSNIRIKYDWIDVTTLGDYTRRYIQGAPTYTYNTTTDGTGGYTIPIEYVEPLRSLLKKNNEHIISDDLFRID